MAINVSVFSRITSNVPVLRSRETWEALVEGIGTHRPTLRKDDLPLYSPAEWHADRVPPHTKELLDTAVSRVHFGSNDLDDVPDEDVLRILEGFERDGIAYLFATSTSHRKVKGATRARVVYPFSRPVLASEWAPFWTAVNARYFFGLADATCRTVGHRYYVPGFIEGGDPPIYRVFPGKALDVEHFVAPVAPTASGVVAGAGTEVTREQLQKIATLLSKSTTKSHLGVAMRQMIKGEAYAANGSRNEMSFRLVCEIIDRHPLADPARLAVHFAPSLALMATEYGGDPGTEKIEDMIRRKSAEPRADLTSQIAEAFNGERATPYDTSDIERITDSLGTETLTRRWIVQKDNSFYVLCDGVYRCYSSVEVESAVIRDLAPAASVGVDLMEVGARGSLRPRTIKELMRLYGAVANSVIVDMSAQTARYDPMSRTFTEAPCPIRVKAEYHAGVETWLNLLAGARKEKLVQWLASVTALDEPCAALYLEGAGGTGKSLLANSIARIFAEAPVGLKELMGDFNESMMHCPVVFADESIPTDHRGRVPTDQIREFIQARSRSLSRKYRPTAQLRGCIRLILAANNMNMLATNENLTEHDIDAISERFLHIHVQEAARDYLLRVNVREWIASDVIAKHVVWLCENYEVERQGRFLISGDASELTNMLATGTGLRAGVCQWIVKYLLNPAPVQNTVLGKTLIKVSKGRLLISSRVISEEWEQYVRSRDVPTPTAVARALGGLSKEYVESGVRWRLIDHARLVSWGNETGYADADGIAKALRRLEDPVGAVSADPTLN